MLVLFMVHETLVLSCYPVLAMFDLVDIRRLTMLIATLDLAPYFWYSTLRGNYRYSLGLLLLCEQVSLSQYIVEQNGLVK